MIELQNITFRYSKKGRIFENLSLELPEGHIHGLLGSNGTGKSTLLKIICGLISPQQGTVSVAGYCPALRQPSLFKDLFIIPEEFGLPAISFRRFAKVTSVFYPNYSQADLDRYVQEFGIDPEANLRKLSMGQRKKAYIAFALACNTQLMLMDEPTNGLDIPAKSAFRKVIAAYADETRTVIISTHQVRDIENLIDNVVIIDRQGVILNKTTEEITEKLKFGVVREDEIPIYSEDTLGGNYGIAENTNHLENKINLEVLFNATLKHRDRICDILNHQTTTR